MATEERRPLRVGIAGSGNIGTDLMLKIDRNPLLELAGVAGIDPESDGLATASARGHWTTSAGLADMLEHVDRLDLVFDATSAKAHGEHARMLAERGIRSVDLTPAALGPAVIPPVNLSQHRAAPDVNLVTCGAQATVPIVAAISRVGPISYAEIVSTISSRSAGPGTRQNIDEFTVATARALETVGGAERGKAIVLLNPADPPIVMRNTVFADVGDADGAAIAREIEATVAAVSAYVPGYRLTAEPLHQDGTVTVLLEVRGAGDYLPEYAGNLDIMTSAAVRGAELFAEEAAA
jgi:acetaldehyde dehydrogenase (acetylating)